MPDKVSTDSLMKRIIKTKSISSFLQHYDESMENQDFCGILKDFCEEKKLIPERVILKAQIDRTYGHQLFNGTRRPSRDKVIQLAIGMGLSVEETQRLLTAAGKSVLYPRIRRDAVLIFSLKNRLDLMKTQELLSGYELSLLGEGV